MFPLTHLPDRGIIEVAGRDRVAFLQGLVSNDVTLAKPGRAVWAALLSPQGKWLSDFFVIAEGERLLLDVERAHAAMLMTRLARFRLRADAALRDLSDALHVHVGPDPIPEAIAAPDPRLADAGWRGLASSILAEGSIEAWDRHRIGLGLPDGSRDLESERTVLLEAGFDELGGISWTKGCYMGQELTARTRYRGLIKRRLVPVALDAVAAAPPPGTAVTRDGVEVGTMRSGRTGAGLATLRLDALQGTALTCGGTALTPRIPAWMRLPETVPA